MRRDKEQKNKRQHKCTDGTLPMIELKRKVGEREQPAEQRHRAVEVVIRNGVKSARTLEERKVMRDQTQTEGNGAHLPAERLARIKELHISGKAKAVGKNGQH